MGKKLKAAAKTAAKVTAGVALGTAALAARLYYQLEKHQIRYDHNPATILFSQRDIMALFDVLEGRPIDFS
jgi:hypothetical protein